MKSLESNEIVTKVNFSADQDDRRLGTVELDLVEPLGLDVLERGRIDHTETDEEHIGLRIGEWPQTVVVFLAGRVPQADVHRLVVDHYIRRVVVEHCRYVLAWKGI